MMDGYMTYVAAGVLAGFAALCMFLWTKAKSLRDTLAARDADLSAARQAQADAETRLQALTTAHEVLKAHLQSKSDEMAALQSRLVLVEERQTALQKENTALHAQSESRARQIDLLNEQMTQERAEHDKHLHEQLDAVKAQLKASAQELLAQRAKELAEANSTQMDAIVSPLKETIREMKTAMDNSRDAHTKTSASLEKAIEEVLKRTHEVGQEADKLANALRNENKLQGNWGEIILEELLSSQGLKEGIHYDVQATLRDSSGRAVLNEESGKRMIPDIVLHYPDGKDAIIDSKASLTAYMDYCNAETDVEREQALRRHLLSIRQHVKELARKDYAAYVKPPRQALGYVIMFVPNESALQLALYNDATLWRQAFESGVFITSEQNLIAALRMIQMAWAQVQQARNQEEVFGLANQLIERVSDFAKLFDEVGKRATALTSAFDDARKKLYAGRQSIVGSANKLVELGAKTSAKKPLPAPEPGLPE